jgi:threonine dehydratase
MTVLTLEDFHAAAKRIAPYVGETPIVAMNPSGLRLKAENLHPIGAFKLRGAFNAILSLSNEERARGVVAHSSGNHAQGVAYAAKTLGVKAVVVMPDNASKVKLDATRAWGADVVQVPVTQRSAKCQELAKANGYAVIEPYDAMPILAGTGTIGLEILRQARDLKYVCVPISGGGLLGGVAAAIGQTNPNVKVIGVEPDLASDAYQSFKAGHIVALPASETGRTIADGLRVSQIGDIPWEHISRFVHDMVTVSEDEIRDAVRRAAAEAHLVAEPSGAVSVAGALKLKLPASETACVLSGGNLDLKSYAKILAG